MLAQHIARLALLPVLLPFAAAGQSGSPPPFRWPSGKHAALSVTFDDARPSQIDVGLPVLAKYRTKATFFVQPDPVANKLDGWKKAAAAGHEIANHSTTHPCTGNYEFSYDNALETYDLAGILRDIDGANAAIERLLGLKPVSFGYPCGQKFVGRGVNVRSYVPLIASRFLAGRGYLDESANDPRVCDLAQLMGTPSDDMDANALLKIVEQAARQGRWLILAGHEIGGPGPQATRISALEAVLGHAANRSNGIWLDTVQNIAAYIDRQRGRRRP